MNVGFQRRAFALQAAGAWCAIDGGTSSAPDQSDARHQEINAACDTLDAFATAGSRAVGVILAGGGERGGGRS